MWYRRIPLVLQSMCVALKYVSKTIWYADFLQEASSRFNVLRGCFSEFHVIANPSSSDESLFDQLVPFLSCEFNGPGVISCGHLSSPFKLESSLCLRNWKNVVEPLDSESRLSVEIFGFLQVSDVKNPPVMCQHTILYDRGMLFFGNHIEFPSHPNFVLHR